MKTYRQLSQDERYQIQAALRKRESVSEIASALGRSPSTIYREIARNHDPLYGCDVARWPNTPLSQKYNASRAQGRTVKRRVAKGARQRKIQGELQTLVETKLRLSWSPEQISARLRDELNIAISHETIYKHILRDCKRLGFYRYCLRYGGYKHHRFKKSKKAERTRARKHPIENRPAEANHRTELGHWERDSLLGKRGGACLLTLEDRKSRYVRLVYVPACEVDLVADATSAALRDMPLKTITNDNGVEFQRDEQLQDRLGVPIYYCNPESPWERGSVENTNGLIRQYFPKGYDFDGLPDWATAAVEHTLNHRPRKCLGYKTPYEILHNTTTHLMTDPSMHFGLEFSLGN